MKGKFTLEQKLQAVKRILQNEETITGVALSIGAGYTPVKRWLIRYEQHGEKGLQPIKGVYTKEFKLQVIKYMLENKVPLMRTAAIFDIHNETTIGIWLKQYRLKGEAGLADTHLKTETMVKKPKKNIIPSNPSTLEEKLAALQRENEYLKAENALLKKLDALIQEDEAARQLSRSQKTSKN